MSRNRVLKFRGSSSPVPWLVWWLNRAEHPEATARLADVIETMQKMVALEVEAQKRDRLNRADRQQLIEWWEHVEGLLSKYSATPQIAALSVRSLLAHGGVPLMWGRPPHRPDDPDDTGFGHYPALSDLIRLSEYGVVGRLRRCELETCQTWFYASPEHKKFCSLKCKQVKTRSKPEWKEHARKYHRDYYLKFQKKKLQRKVRHGKSKRSSP
jgi:hypothetical protein